MSRIITNPKLHAFACILLAALLLTACGHRGDLKRPAQIEQERIKKEQQKDKDPTLIPELRPNPNGSF